MAGPPRSRTVDPRKVATYHCWNRCVRRAQLCGHDPVSGKHFDHRRDWIESRERLLARLFGIDVNFHTEMSNHIHLVLRSRPDIVATWSDEEVVRRWLKIAKLTRNFEDIIEEPDDGRVATCLANKEYVDDVRLRLSNISSFMAALCEYVARRSNREDGVSGKFWEARFKCRECTDEASILILGIYVDLNQVRAGEADRPENSKHSSAYNRIQARLMSESSAVDHADHSRMPADGWMSPLTIDQGPDADASPGKMSSTPWRASDLGILPISLEQYLELLDWTGRQIRADKPGSIPTQLAPILERLGIRAENWLETIVDTQFRFRRAIGRLCSMKKAAAETNRKWFHGVGSCSRVFA